MVETKEAGLSLSARERQKEEFKASLVEDVFGQGKEGKVQMEKVTMLIWQFRDDPRVVHFVAQFVAKYSGSRDVFDGIEFYLPQIAHMIIHLEVNWDDAILERFALIISQQSLHFALQFNWILQGAIEDYQPETSDGLPNPAYNARFYSRCVKLLNNIERCVVYGTPRSNELQRLYEKGKISKQEYDLLELADRRFNAALLSESDASNSERVTMEEHPQGWLLYKRRVRKAPYKRKPWKSRFFSASDRMLYCHDDHPQQGGVLIRAMPLEGAKVAAEEGKYPFMFKVVNQHYSFVMRADNQQDADRWIAQLEDESKCNSLFSSALVSSLHSNGEAPMNNGHIIADLTPSQRARYDFYKGERNFLRDVCDVAEKLRFEDRATRKKLAPGYVDQLQIPECSYSPMCNSTDVWRRIHTCISKDTKVFNTKERCPTMIYFITKRGENKPDNLDVATYMNDRFTTADPRIESIPEEPVDDEGSVIMDPQNLTNSIAPQQTAADDPKKSDIKSSDGLKGANRKVNRFVKDHALHVMPNNLLRQLKSRTFRSSRKITYDMSTLPAHDVKIVETAKSWETDDDATAVLDHPNELIDLDCLERAKKIVCGEMWAERSERMLEEALNSGLVQNDGSKIEIGGVMAKSNDDLRQEVFVMQMIHYYKSVFANEGLPIWLYTYRILSVSKETGLIEIIHDSTSIDSLRKSPDFPEEGGLLAYFHKVYGVDTPSFKMAQRNFMLSLVGYSLVSYLLGLKDRHNGNIMITIRGHLIFIDFGFAMGMAPGHEWSLERSPFKLVKDYMDVMGGEKSQCFAEFKRLFVAGFEAARKKSQIAMGLVEIMMYKSNFPCFTGARYGDGISMKRFEDRLMLDVPDHLVTKKALGLIEAALHSNGTVLYDKFQYYSNGYFY